MKKLPYNHLTKFVIGALLAIFVCSIFTEFYFTSSVLEYRKLQFSCLSYYLQSKNITDEYFTDATPPENPSQCEEIINQYKLNVTLNLTTEYYAAHDLSWNICEEIVKPLCDSSSDKSTQANFKSDQSKEKCFEKNSLKNTQDNLDELYIATKAKCENVSICLGCIKEKLLKSGDNDDYESSMLHVKAVNLTSSVIEFRFWKYFKVTSRVGELLNDVNALRDSAVNDCKKKWKMC